MNLKTRGVDTGDGGDSVIAFSSPSAEKCSGLGRIEYNEDFTYFLRFLFSILKCKCSRYQTY
jgi:hypothetical protein